MISKGEKMQDVELLKISIIVAIVCGKGEVILGYQLDIFHIIKDAQIEN